jgi:hypothetical protein
MTSGVRSGNGQVSITYKVTPTLATNASAGVGLGGSVHDTATLAGGSSPTGTITFDLYGPGDPNCSGTPAFTDTKPVSGNGDYDSAEFTPSEAGTYRWVASYAGDGDNEPVSGACGDPNETVTVTAAPDLRILSLERDREAGTATLTVATNLAGNLNVDKTKKVKGFGPARLDDAGQAELEVVPRNRFARKLEEKGGLTVNPRIRLFAAADGVKGIRHEFTLRQD